MPWNSDSALFVNIKNFVLSKIKRTMKGYLKPYPFDSRLIGTNFKLSDICFKVITNKEGSIQLIEFKSIFIKFWHIHVDFEGFTSMSDGTLQIGYKLTCYHKCVEIYSVHIAFMNRF